MRPRDENTPDATEHARAERGRELIAEALADPRTLAPPHLRDAIEHERARAAASAGPGSRRRFGMMPRRLLATGGALAAVIVAIVVVSGGGDADPSVERIAAVSRLTATASAPSRVPGTTPAQLNVAVEGLEFPDWQEEHGWRATGRRADRVGGRSVTTVFYRNAKGATLGYAIVAGDALSGAPAGDDVVKAGETYRVAHDGGRTTVSWTQEGHTCVIDAPSTVADAKLLEFASSSNI